MESELNNKLFLDERIYEEDLPKPPKLNLATSIGDICKSILDESGKDIYAQNPHKLVAERLGMTIAVLRQRLYKNCITPGQGENRLSRDWIIAICSAYGLNSVNTDKVLIECGFASFDGGNIRRDELIQRYLNDSNGPYNIDVFQRYLSDHGTEPLKLTSRRKNIISEATVNLSPYIRVSKVKLRTYGLEKPFDSMADEYFPSLTCSACIFVKDADSNEFFFMGNSDGTCDVEKENESIQEYNSPENAPKDMRMLLEELVEHARKEKQRIDDIYNDTRNFKTRFSVNLKDDYIHVFYEEYNYSQPYRNEFFLMEYYQGMYILSVANKSMFMEEYLSTSEYFIHYHTHDKIKRKIYTRLEDIDFPCKKVKSYFASDYIALRDKYKELRQIVKKILIDIQMQKLTIRDISYMNEMDIIVYYNLQDSFILSHEGFDEIKESAEMVDADGHSVTITYSDLEKAFMLGIDNIDIIIRLKIKFGNIENVLNT